MEQVLKACEVGEIGPGQRKALALQGKQIALFNIGGSFHAIDNVCPHRGGELAKGTLEGNVISCPLHHWKFDVTNGVCTSRPGIKAKSYPLRMQDQAVMITFVLAAESNANGRRYLVRFGNMGHLGWFVAGQADGYGRGQRVVVQSVRGMETGEIMVASRPSTAGASDDHPAGEVLRPMSPEDEFQDKALRQGEHKAFEECRRLLAERNMPVELLDVEQLLDGEKILFYFLGDPPPEMADLTEELAKTYETRVEFRQFMERAEAGCGPGCGTDDAPGCGSDGGACSTCADSGTCAVKEILGK